MDFLAFRSRVREFRPFKWGVGIYASMQGLESTWTLKNLLLWLLNWLHFLSPEISRLIRVQVLPQTSYPTPVLN